MKKLFTLLAAVIFMASVSVSVSGAEKNMYGHNMFGSNFKKFQEQLNLTEEQKQAFDELNAAQKEKQAPIKEKIKQLGDEKKAAFENNDYEAAKAKVREMSVLEGDMKANFIDYKKAVSDILTQEQREKFKELAAKAKEERKEMMKEKKDRKDKKGKKEKKAKKEKKK
jgi:Spy/CpxP family protein refolding chaperone